MGNAGMPAVVLHPYRDNHHSKHRKKRKHEKACIQHPAKDEIEQAENGQGAEYRKNPLRDEISAMAVCHRVVFVHSPADSKCAKYRK